MLFRVIGAIMIVAGTAAWGIGGVMRLRARVRILAALTSSMELMRGEVCERLTPVPELMDTLAGAAPPPVSSFYSYVGSSLSGLGDMSFSELWRRGVENTPELLLTREEERALRELGLTLGRYTAAEQRPAIEFIKSKFSAFTERAETERDMNSRLHAFLGVSAGLFAVIILL